LTASGADGSKGALPDEPEDEGCGGGGETFQKLFVDEARQVE
jgi:hypothetical protein